MRPVVLPDVAYGSTAVRPNWEDLPASVRDAVSRRLGLAVIGATSAGGGFTRAFAAVLNLADGSHAFLKAAPADDPVAEIYAREATITATLPAAVRAPRPRWTLTTAGYFLLCLEYAEGHVPAMPWKTAELDAAVRAWTDAAQALTPPEPPDRPDHPTSLARHFGNIRAVPSSPDESRVIGVGSPHFADGIEVPPVGWVVRDSLSWWSEIAAGRLPLPHTAPGWVTARLSELAALEQDLPALAAGTTMLHGDLRVDNLIIDPDGTARICDWTWPCLGAPWFDTVTLLVTAYASGHDTDAYLRDAPRDGVDGVLAAMSGYWLCRAAGEPSGASPHSRQHQLYSGGRALAWLAERRGW